MSVVGLSFGSPTSGDGFDVSKTVSQIVENLQNVETPWKNQLMTLGSEDTVISSLGTLLSTLSTDMTSLTEATGVLSEKAGSSSNSSVLELDSASSSAVAGTHTVLVSELAKTSSGYLTEVTDSLDTLSGSIVIQVGSGTAQTITLDSSSDTLSGLASAINSSGIGVTASVLTDSSGSRLSLVSGTSGTNGEMTVTSSITDTTNSDASLTYKSATTGADGSITVDGAALTISSNTVSDMIPGVTFDLLSKSDTAVQVVIANYNTGVESSVKVLVSDYNALVSAISTQEGYDSSGNAEPLYGSPTLNMLQQDILGGVNTTNPNGYLTAVSTTAGTTLSGSMTIATTSGFLLSDSVTAGTNADTDNGTSAVTSSATLTGGDSESDMLSGSIVIQVGSSGTAHTITLDSSDNTLAGLASAINDASTKLSATVTVGTDASGSTSATTSMSTLTASTGAVLSGTLQVLAGTGTAENIVIGAEPSTGAADNTIYTGSGVDTLSGLADTINGDTSLGLTAKVTTATDGSQTLTLTSGTSGSDGTLTVNSSLTASIGVTAAVTTTDGKPTLTLTSGTSGTNGSLTVTNSIRDTSAQTISVPTTSGENTVDGLAAAINAADIGVTATVVTKNSNSTLTLTSRTSGSSGAVVVTSAITATSDTALKATVTSGSSNASSSATLTTISASDDTLSGSIVIQVGSSGTAHTVTLDSSDNTLADLASAIISAGIGVTATVDTDGTTLTLKSGTPGTEGTLTVTSSILDTTNTSNAKLPYTSSSDIGSLSGLGISVNTDGTLSLDETVLNSVLNTDYSSVTGFFENVNSWGATFSDMLTNVGTSSSTGILKLAAAANSSTEFSLNKNISREESLISSEEASLTKELNNANEIMQMIPTQLEGINKLYSAITGYNQSR